MIVRFLVQYPFILDVAVVLLAALLVVGGMRLGSRRRWMGHAVVTFVLLAVAVFGYGRFVGAHQLVVNRVLFESSDLPEAFDGYRIVQFSDAHVGSFTGWREAFLREAIDSINAQQADLVVFTGDLQNRCSDEVDRHSALLATISGRDGVVAVLGNHDYAMYLSPHDTAAVARQLGGCDSVYARLGWTLLRNAHRCLHRGADSIVVAGMENDGEGRFPQLGDVAQTLRGVPAAAFVVMLEHDPTAWRRKILPESGAQLTLSGHTHGGQVSLFGLTPAAFVYPECRGLYTDGPRALYVNSGLGGSQLLRLGCPAEVTVVTLQKRKN